MRRFFETRVGAVMALSCLAGLIMPGLPHMPDITIAIALALLMFLSCYRLKDGGFSGLDWRSIGRFYALRYLFLPALLWLVARALAPEFATAILLMTALPAAVASPAFSHLLGGAVAPAFVIVVASQLMAPAVIPLQFALLEQGAHMPAPAHLFTTLALCVLAPMAVYALAKRHRASAAYFYAQGKWLSMLLVAFMIALAVAKVRHIILDAPQSVALPLAVSLACYAFYIAFGWYAAGSDRAEKITFSVCSSFNNLGLGVSLALLHFPPNVILFMAISEISWSLLPTMTRGFLRFLPR